MTNAEYKQERLKRGLTQQALADYLGVTQESISRRESGKQRITQEAELALLSIDICRKLYQKD